MGHEITSGSRDLCFTHGAWQVRYWCERFWFEEDGDPYCEDLVGSTDIPAKVVKRADAVVPAEYPEAKARGFIDTAMSEREFQECRNFLRNAAQGNHRIWGSY